MILGILGVATWDWGRPNRPRSPIREGKMGSDVKPRYAGNEKAYMKWYRETHKEEIKGMMRRLRHTPKYRQYFREREQLRRDGYKNQVLEHYGNKCACCGELEPLFLTIDHMDNDGAQHRRSLAKSYGSVLLYKWLVQHGFPTNFQILCRNCNWGKYANKGICPHSETKEVG